MNDISFILVIGLKEKVIMISATPKAPHTTLSKIIIPTTTTRPPLPKEKKKNKTREWNERKKQSNQFVYICYVPFWHVSIFYSLHSPSLSTSLFIVFLFSFFFLVFSFSMLFVLSHSFCWLCIVLGSITWLVNNNMNTNYIIVDGINQPKKTWKKI